MLNELINKHESMTPEELKESWDKSAHLDDDSSPKAEEFIANLQKPWIKLAEDLENKLFKFKTELNNLDDYLREAAQNGNPYLHVLLPNLKRRYEVVDEIKSLDESIKWCYRRANQERDEEHRKRESTLTREMFDKAISKGALPFKGFIKDNTRYFLASSLKQAKAKFAKHEDSIEPASIEEFLANYIFRV